MNFEVTNCEDDQLFSDLEVEAMREMANTAYIVSEFTDCVKEKPLAQLLKSEAKAKVSGWYYKPATYFLTRSEAEGFIISRAGDKVDKAGKALKQAETRLGKCLKKFSTTPPAGEGV